MEWLRFCLTALFMLGGVFFIAIGIFGVFRFKFALNRMHTASMIDTLGVLFIVIALVIASGISFSTIKLVLLVAFIWVGSPIASHLVSLLEVDTDNKLSEHLKYSDRTKEDK